MHSRTADSLTFEVTSDHSRILGALRAIRSSPDSAVTMLPNFCSLLGAHHLAEEKVLYAYLEDVTVGLINESKTHHMLVDDLASSIMHDANNSTMRNSKLKLLYQLLKAHFATEETEILNWLSGAQKSESLAKMGQHYRCEFNLILRDLQNDGNER